MRFDLALTQRIQKYKDAQWFSGSRIRWMIQDQQGTHVYCDKCGNIANGVLWEPVERYELKIPMCRHHLQEWMREHPDYQWQDRTLSLVPVAAQEAA